MKKLSSLLIILVISLAGTAQIITIKDSLNNTPLDMVSLASNAPRVLSFTNHKGQVDITPFKDASSIEVRILGYKTIYLSYDDILKKNTIYLTEKKLSLDEVVITATRFGQTKRETPTRINIISSKDASLLNPQTAADLLGVSGEVYIQKSQQGGGSPMIRGFATNRLLYTIDGVRMNTAIFRAGNIHNVIALDPLTIEHTEIAFGPSSVVYGSDAIGGVMGFKTLTPQLSLDKKIYIKGKAVSRYASANNEKTFHLDINQGWQHWATLSSISFSDYGNLRMGHKGPNDYIKPYYVKTEEGIDKIIKNPDSLVQIPSSYNQLNLMQKIRYKPSNAWDIHYGFHLSESSHFSRYDRLIEVDNNGKPKSAVWEYGPQKWLMNMLEITHDKEKRFYNQLFVRLAWQKFEESRIDRKFNHHRLRTQTEKVNAYSLNIDFSKSLSKHHIMYGMEYILNDVFSEARAIDIRNNKEMDVAARYPNSTWQNYALYLNNNFRINNSWLIHGGLRLCQYQIHSDFTAHNTFYAFDFDKIDLKKQALTGALGLTYSPDNDFKTSLSASTAYRAPNIDDMGKLFDFQAGDVIVPNPNLKEEYAYNMELNTSKVIQEWLKIELSIYHTLLNNAMVRRPYALNGQDSLIYNGELSKVYAIQNAAYLKVNGIYAGIDVNMSKTLSLNGKFNYQQGSEEMDNGQISPSRHAAPWFGLAQIKYHKKKIYIQLYSIFNGGLSYDKLNEEERQKVYLYAKDKNGQPYSPAWTTYNIKGSYLLNEELSVNVGIENITDIRYRPYSSGLTAAGRNYVISIKATF